MCFQTKIILWALMPVIYFSFAAAQGSTVHIQLQPAEEIHQGSVDTVEQIREMLEHDRRNREQIEGYFLAYSREENGDRKKLLRLDYAQARANHLKDWVFGLVSLKSELRSGMGLELDHRNQAAGFTDPSGNLFLSGTETGLSLLTELEQRLNGGNESSLERLKIELLGMWIKELRKHTRLQISQMNSTAAEEDFTERLDNYLAFLKSRYVELKEFYAVICTR